MWLAKKVKNIILTIFVCHRSTAVHEAVETTTSLSAPDDIFDSVT